jgi:hypothetical protein
LGAKAFQKVVKLLYRWTPALTGWFEFPQLETLCGCPQGV